MSATGCWVLKQRSQSSDATALIADGRNISYAELADGVEQTASALVSLGVGARDRVAVWMTGGIRFVEILHACQRVGATFIPLNLRLAEPELRRQLEFVRPSLLVLDPGHERAATARQAGAGLVRTLSGNDVCGLAGNARLLPPDQLDPGALHSIVFTSGTSDTPKAVALTNANFAASVASAVQGLGMEPYARWLAVMPPFHVGGLAILVRAAILGSTVALRDGFDASAVCRDLRSHRITGISLVSLMLDRLLACEGAALPFDDLRCVLVGGGPLPAALARQSLARGLPIAPTYGMTETAAQMATATPGGPVGARGYVGQPLPGVQLRIEAPDREGRGEIWVRGAQIMRGYLDNEALNAERIVNGWLRTGDAGRLDQEGNLYVEERLGDLIITGGENVCPTEVEQILIAHEDVADAAVVGAVNSEWGQRVEAYIVLQPDSVWKPEALAAWCRTQLGDYKIPRVWHRVASLPRSDAGKLLRRALVVKAPSSKSN